MSRPTGLARRLDGAIGAFAGTVLFLMMALTAVDVVGRYLFNRPFRGSLELTEILMTVMIFAGLPLVTAKGGHVTVDIADVLIPSAVKRWLGFAVHVICAFALSVLAWRLATKAMQLAAYGDTTAALLLPLWPLAWFMALGTALAALAMAWRAVASPPWRPADAVAQVRVEKGAL
jgi:TRAP-type C4-dicarboxylate transport system permease small subunit